MTPRVGLVVLVPPPLGFSGCLCKMGSQVGAVAMPVLAVCFFSIVGYTMDEGLPGSFIHLAMGMDIHKCTSISARPHSVNRQEVPPRYEYTSPRVSLKWGIKAALSNISPPQHLLSKAKTGPGMYSHQVATGLTP